MSVMTSLSSATLKVGGTTTVVSTAAAAYTGVTWPAILLYTGLGIILIGCSLWRMFGGERANRKESVIYETLGYPSRSAKRKIRVLPPGSTTPNLVILPPEDRSEHKNE
jgi:hypothetical protein